MANDVSFQKNYLHSFRTTTMERSMLFLLLGIICKNPTITTAFVQSYHHSRVTAVSKRRVLPNISLLLAQKKKAQRLSFVLLAKEDDDDSKESTSDLLEKQQQKLQLESSSNNSILRRFTNPVIDDPFLPLNDALVAQIIAPSLQIAWLALNQAPSPTWLQPLFASSTVATIAGGTAALRGSLLAPVLIHGAALATAWCLGALAAQAYERDALVRDLPTTLIRTVQAGAFASGLLIFATQLDLLIEYHGHWIELGESPETDFRLQVAVVEMVNDIVFEAVCLTAFRVYLLAQSRRAPR